jgi:hypothetical protein
MFIGEVKPKVGTLLTEIKFLQIKLFAEPESIKKLVFKDFPFINIRKVEIMLTVLLGV